MLGIFRSVDEDSVFCICYDVLVDESSFTSDSGVYLVVDEHTTTSSRSFQVEGLVQQRCHGQ